MPEDLLRIENLSLRRDSRDILRQVSLGVQAGQVHGLLGPNGSGKSSLAYTLMGCHGYAPDAGRIYFDGQDITSLPIDERARLGITLAWQEPARFEGLTVPFCPLANYIVELASQAAAALPNVGQVTVDLLDEPWRPPSQGYNWD
jgi:Fe-S cluster assembly ATPase SufC